MNVDGPYQPRRILVTGATGGVGRAIVAGFQRAGDDVVATGRDRGRLAELEDGGAMVLRADFDRTDDIAELARRAGPVDVVVNAAAVHGSGTLDQLGSEDLAATVQTNLMAPMSLTQAVLPHMLAKGEGHLVYISSLSGLSGFVGAAGYSATKFGLRGFSQSLRQDLAGTGVGVTVLFLGFVREAGMFANSGRSLPRWVSTSSPDQVADAVVNAVDRRKDEVVVGSWSVRLAARAAGVAPRTAQRVTRLLIAQMTS